MSLSPGRHLGHRSRRRAALSLGLAASALLVAFPPHLGGTQAAAKPPRHTVQVHNTVTNRITAPATNNNVCQIVFNPVIKLNNQQNQRQQQAITQTVTLSNTNIIKNNVRVVTVVKVVQVPVVRVVTKIVPVEVDRVVKVPVYITKVVYPVQTAVPHPTPTPYDQAASPSMAPAAPYPTPTDTPMPYVPPAYP